MKIPKGSAKSRKRLKKNHENIPKKKCRKTPKNNTGRIQKATKKIVKFLVKYQKFSYKHETSEKILNGTEKISNKSQKKKQLKNRESFNFNARKIKDKS